MAGIHKREAQQPVQYTQTDEGIIVLASLAPNITLLLNILKFTYHSMLMSLLHNSLIVVCF